MAAVPRGTFASSPPIPQPILTPPCSLSKCNYSITYADKSFSNGYYARDVLTLSAEHHFPNFNFSCGQNNSDGFGIYAGFLGLAQGEFSFLAQTERSFAYLFCYCIPSKDNSHGYLLFGFGALIKCQTDRYTKILPGPYHYYVKLPGITIVNQRLEFLKLVSMSRTIIDSGTTISRLPPSVYSALRDEFKRQMSEYPVALALPPLLDTCYNLEGHESPASTVVLNFDGVNVKLDPSGVVWRKKDSHVCFAFAANDKEDDLVIIGSTQQRNLNILYDIQENKVGFGTGSCGNRNRDLAAQVISI